MFPANTWPVAAAFNWPAAVEVRDEIPGKFEGLTDVRRKFVNYIWPDSGFSAISFLWTSIGTFLAITVPACMMLCFDRRKKKSSVATYVFEVADVNGESSDRLIDGPSGGDGITGEVARVGDAPYVDDAEYAEQIQFHEALLASSFSTQVAANNPSSSIQEPVVNNEPVKFEDGLHDSSSESFCEICLENKENWQMFTNDECSHSFCYGCTSSHIVAKIQDKFKEIPCPALRCKAALNTIACRLMIPDDALIQLDELLCMSFIPDSQKLYCPFRDCSTLLLNDSEEPIQEVRCAACKRHFCAECRVPWHPEFTCKEFQKLYAKKGSGKGDKIVKELAMKKSWQKCPKCKMYVEKSTGCVHITCRCKYEFCYRCGSKWSDSHGSCRPKVTRW